MLYGNPINKRSERRRKYKPYLKKIWVDHLCVLDTTKWDIVSGLNQKINGEEFKRKTKVDDMKEEELLQFVNDKNEEMMI